MKVLWKFLLLLIVLVVLFTAIFYYLGKVPVIGNVISLLSKLLNPFKHRVEVNIIGSVLYDIQQIGFLRLVTVLMEDVVKTSDYEYELDSILDGKYTVDGIYIYRAKASYGIDLFKVEQNDVIIDESQKKITIHLPPIELLDSNINVERSETFNENFKSKILGTFEVGAIDKWVPLPPIELLDSNINVERSETFNENFKSKILGTFEVGAIDKWVPLDIKEKVKSFCDEKAREKLTENIKYYIMSEDKYSEMKTLAERYIRNLLSPYTEKGYTVEISFKE